MRSSRLLLLFALATVACAPATSAPSTGPAPVAVARAPDVAAIPPVRMDEPPKNWHLLDETADKIPGISAERAMKELLAGKQPQRTVLVAIIDSGIDTAHVDLRANL